MGYDIELRYEKEVAEVPLHREGGVACTLRTGENMFEIGGSSRASIHVTNNYSMFFIEHLGEEGLRELYGKRAESTIPKLEAVVDALSNFCPDKDYWKPTAGNAKKVLEILLDWARLHPKATWKVIG